MRQSFTLTLLAAAIPCALFAADSGLTSLSEGGHWKRVRSLAQARLAANPADAEAAYRLSQARAAFGDLDGALELAEKAAALDPRSAELRSHVAEVCGQMTDAAGMFRALSLARRVKRELSAALAIEPRSRDALWGLMEFHMEAPGIAGGDKAQARLLAEEIGRINPLQGILARAHLAEMEKNAAEQEALYNQALAADPRSYEVRLRLASYYYALPRRNFERAGREAKEALKIDPSRSWPYAILAGIDAASGRWEDLDAILAEAERAVPDDLNPAYQAGKTLLLDGREYPRAERCFRKYLTQEPEGGAPSQAGAHWRLGQVLEKEGRTPEAKGEMETAVRLDPRLEGAKDDLKRLR